MLLKTKTKSNVIFIIVLFAIVFFSQAIISSSEGLPSTRDDWQYESNPNIIGVNPVLYFDNNKINSSFKLYYSINIDKDTFALQTRTASNLLTFDQPSTIASSNSPFHVSVFDNMPNMGNLDLLAFSFSNQDTKMSQIKDLQNSTYQIIIIDSTNVNLFSNNGIINFQAFVSYNDMSDENNPILTYQTITNDTLGNKQIISRIDNGVSDVAMTEDGTVLAMYSLDGALYISAKSPQALFFDTITFSTEYRPFQLLQTPTSIYFIMKNANEEFYYYEYTNEISEIQPLALPNNNYILSRIEQLDPNGNIAISTNIENQIIFSSNTNQYFADSINQEGYKKGQTSSIYSTPYETVNEIDNQPFIMTPLKTVILTLILVSIILWLSNKYVAPSNTKKNGARKNKTWIPLNDSPIGSAEEQVKPERKFDPETRYRKTIPSSIEKLMVEEMALVKVPELGKQVRACCFQTARLGEQYCYCGRGIDKNLAAIFTVNENK